MLITTNRCDLCYSIIPNEYDAYLRENGGDEHTRVDLCPDCYQTIAWWISLPQSTTTTASFSYMRQNRPFIYKKGRKQLRKQIEINKEHLLNESKPKE